MSKFFRVLAIILLLAMAGTLKPDYLPAGYTSISFPLPADPSFQYANPNLWGNLRLGLNYLESPEPLSPPETVPPTYEHPDSKGFGAFGFSLQAYQDVQRLYPFFKDYAWKDILHSQQLYDRANQAFADWLLKNLRDYIPGNATQEEIFNVLHKAWNLGLSGFKNGRHVVLSREKRAEEFYKLSGTSLMVIAAAN